MKTMLINDDVPHTPGWQWQQTHCDNFIVWGPEKEMRKYRSIFYITSDGNPPYSLRSYADLCWWCGTRGINPKEFK